MNDELKHYRTKGSKNGERKYQYPDGSLTPLGREHYGVGPAREKKSKDDEKGSLLDLVRKGHSHGPRRYQNADGSLTEEGKRRYLKEKSEKTNSEEPKSSDVTPYGEPVEWYFKSKSGQKERMADYKNMSDADLKALSDRLVLEKAYLDNLKKYNETFTPDKTFKDKLMATAQEKAVNAIADLTVNTGKNLAIKLGTKMMADLAKDMAEAKAKAAEEEAKKRNK